MWRNAGSIIAGLMLCMPMAHAQFARQDFIPIPIEDMTEAEFLTGQKGRIVTVAGALRLPKIGAKLPVVVLLHGGSGIGGSKNYVEVWASVLNTAGYGTFTVDSFTGRGALSPADVRIPFGKVAPIPRTIDAYRALQVLAKHPGVDPTRIVLMGFSHGSYAALYGNTERFQKQYGSPDLQYAAYISVYGICITRFRGDEGLTKPLLMLHGVADDWVPISKCREYAARLQRAGRKVSLIEYADAHHAFDAPFLPAEVRVPDGNSVINCSLEEGENGAILNAVSKQPLTPQDPCVRKGPTAGYNEAAMKKAHEDVKAFLLEVFAQK